MDRPDRPGIAAVETIAQRLGRWLGAGRRVLPASPGVASVPVLILFLLFLAGLYFVLDLFFGIFDHSAAPLEAIGLFLVAVVAGLLYAGVVAWLDRNEKEPWRLVISVLLLGIVASFGLKTVLARAARDDFSRLSASPPFTRAELTALFPNDEAQILALRCDRPELAVEALRALDGIEVARSSGTILYLASDTLSEDFDQVVDALQEAGVTVEGSKRYDSPRDFLYQRAWPQARSRIWDTVASKRLGPLIEEISKGLIVLLLFLGLQREFDGPLDGIVYGALVGLGFAVTENALFMITRDPQAQFLHRIVMRGLSGHATYTALTGLGLGLSRAYRDRPTAGFLPTMGFVAGLVAHTIWNTFNYPVGREVGFFPAVLILNGPFLALVALGLYLSWRQEDRVIRHYLPADLLDPTTYAAAEDLLSARARRRARRRASRELGRGSARLVSATHRALIEIAFCHWRAERFGLELVAMPDLPPLRQLVLELRARLAGDQAQP